MKAKYLLFFIPSLLAFSCAKNDDPLPGRDSKPGDFQILFIENSEGGPQNTFMGELKCVDAEGNNLTEVTSNAAIPASSFFSVSQDYSQAVFHAISNGPCRPRDIFSLDLKTLLFQRKTNSVNLAHSSGCQNLTTYSDPWLSSDGSAIAAVKSDGESNSIVLLDENGQEEINLSSIIDLEIKSNYKPRWSPDGTKLAFSTRHFTNNEKTEALWRICVINRDGSNPIFIGSFSVAIITPRWSHDGSQIIYEIQEQDPQTLEITLRTSKIMSDRGTNDRFLAPQLESVAVGSHSFFSDNQRVLSHAIIDPITLARGIVIIDLQTGVYEQVNAQSELFIQQSSLSLSPDEQWILYQASELAQPGNSSNVWKIRVDGTENQKLTHMNYVSIARWTKP